MVLVMLTVFYASFLDADSVPLRLSVILGSRLPAPLDGVLLDLLLLLLLTLSSVCSFINLCINMPAGSAVRSVLAWTFRMPLYQFF